VALVCVVQMVGLLIALSVWNRRPEGLRYDSAVEAVP
jgi:hypothetical protein